MALDRLLQSVPLSNEKSHIHYIRKQMMKECEHEILEVHSAMTGGDYIIRCQKCSKEWKDFAVLVEGRSR